MTGPDRRYWLSALSLAEACGIAVVAVTYAAIDRGLIGAEAASMLAAGAIEGLCLGSAQAAGLRRLGARTGLWVVLTMAGAMLGYGLSLLGQMGGGEAAGDAADPPLWLMALAGGGVGLGMGAVMGLVQTPALPRSMARRRWVLANMLGWVPAMAVIMAAAGVAGRDWPLAQVAALGAGSGAVAGLCVALATWPVLSRRET